MNAIYQNVERSGSSALQIKAGMEDGNGVTWNDYLAFLDGVDVSMRCVEASEAEGWVRVMPEARAQLDYRTGGLLTVVLHGHVRLERRSIHRP